MPRNTSTASSADEAHCHAPLTTSTSTATSVSGDRPDPGTTYYWRVFAHNSAGVTDANDGTTASFTTSLPGEFGKISPPNGWTAQGTSPTLTWGPSVGASSYGYLLRLGERRCVHAVDERRHEHERDPERAGPMDVVLLAGARGERDGDDLRRPRIMVGLRRGARERGQFSTRAKCGATARCPVGGERHAAGHAPRRDLRPGGRGLRLRMRGAD